jgi:hypothetical protein
MIQRGSMHTTEIWSSDTEINAAQRDTTCLIHAEAMFRLVWNVLLECWQQYVYANRIQLSHYMHQQISVNTLKLQWLQYVPPALTFKTRFSSKSKLCYDLRSVGQSVLVSSIHLWLTPRFLYLSDSCGFVDVGRRFWREDGSVFYNV